MQPRIDPAEGRSRHPQPLFAERPEV